MRELAQRHASDLALVLEPLALGIVPDEFRHDLGGADIGATLVEVAVLDASSASLP